MFRGYTTMFLVAVSFFGLFLIAMLTVSPPVLQGNFVWRKPIVGCMFASICVLGILAVFFPNECSRVFDFGNEEERLSVFHGFKRGFKASLSDSAALRGHHPTCGRFSSHVFRLDEGIFCATCSGLFLGALIVLGGVALYFFGNFQMGQHVFSVVWIGISGVSFGLLQPPLLTVRRSLVRIFSSAVLAIGTLLILVGTDELAHNLFLDVFLVFLTFLWLTTRISLSQWEHDKICKTCGSAYCDLADRTKNRSLG